MADDPDERTWEARVRAARRLPPTANGPALLHLLQDAVGAQPVWLAPRQRSSGPVSPDDYAPFPTLNLDLDLEEREFWPRAGRRGRLGPRTGYAFTHGAQSFAILAPRAIEHESPDFVRLHAFHELFHARVHRSAGTPRAERELEAWTAGFCRFFLPLAPYRRRWRPWLEAYEGSGPAACERAEADLKAWYAGATPAGQRTFAQWVLRRCSDAEDWRLAHRLERGLLGGA